MNDEQDVSLADGRKTSIGKSAQSTEENIRTSALPVGVILTAASQSRAAKSCELVPVLEIGFGSGAGKRGRLRL